MPIRVPAKGSRRLREARAVEPVHLAEIAVRVRDLQVVTAALTGQVELPSTRTARFDRAFPDVPDSVDPRGW